MVQNGFHFNASRCTGCKTCVMACRDYHDLGPELAFRQVYEMCGGSWVSDAEAWRQDCFAYYLSMACNHCSYPVCVEVCPTGAMGKDEAGMVAVDSNRCIGCGYCAMSCPYHAPKVDRKAGCSAKCDGCRERVAAGMKPVCVEACPLRALDFGAIEKLREQVGSSYSIPPMPDNRETEPSLVIAPPACFIKDPERVSREARVANMRELV